MSTQHADHSPQTTRFARRTRRGVSLFVAACALVVASSAHAAEKRTAFKPEVHGLNFVNTFNNDFIPDIDVRTGGLCGGMVYTALDYFNASDRDAPLQDYRPANRTKLQSYIYNRQVDSLVPNATKWVELGANPGTRNAEFFSWGLGSELKNLQQKIDAGKPVPLGLQGMEGGVGHQVLAIGYKTGARKADLEIYLYDPNFPEKLITMKPNMGGKHFYYEGEDSRWRTYFVDKSYGKKKPPVIANPFHPKKDGRYRELLVHFDTGADDLRGGKDNVDLIIHFHGGYNWVFKNINLRARWLNNYTETASVPIFAGLDPSKVKEFEFRTTFRGGIAGDNWDVRRITIEGFNGQGPEGNGRDLLARDNKFHRITGDRRSVRVPMTQRTPAQPGQVAHLDLEITTGGDDLRGNEDNVNAIVLFRDGSQQKVPTINERKRWADHTTKNVSIELDRPQDPKDIVGVTLTTTFRGGFNGDNWNMKSLKVYPVINHHRGDAYYSESRKPLFRFTGSKKRFTARW